MTRLKLILLPLAILLLTACAVPADDGGQASSTLALAIRDEQGLYHHPEIPWGSSVQEVESILGKTLDLHRIAAPVYVDEFIGELPIDITQMDRVPYVCADAMVWDDRSAYAKLYFTNNEKVGAIEYGFQDQEDDLTYIYDSIREKLLDQFGEPDIIDDNDSLRRISVDELWKRTPLALEPPHTVITRIAGSLWNARVDDELTVVGISKCYDPEGRVFLVVLEYQFKDMMGL